MLVRYVLLTLPVHRRSFQEYYQQHDLEAEKLKPEIERQWGHPFPELPPHIQLYWKDQWYWPPWFFNDVVGHLHVGSDGGEQLAGDLYLERRFFPPTAPEKFSRHQADAEEQEEIVYLASLGGHPIDPEDNRTYLLALAEIVGEAQEAIRRQGDGLPGAELWLPGYDFSCFDLARADRQLRERFPGRGEDGKDRLEV